MRLLLLFYFLLSCLDIVFAQRIDFKKQEQTVLTESTMMVNGSFLFNHIMKT